MLHHLAGGVQAKDVDPCPITIPGPLLVAVQDHVVAFGDHPLDLHVLARVLAGHALEVGDEGGLAAGRD